MRRLSPYKRIIFLLFIGLTLMNCRFLSEPKNNDFQINTPRTGAPVPFKNMLGINAYEWNFLEDFNHKDDRSHIYEDNMRLIQSFTAVRHYLDWKKLEPTRGHYTFNPTRDGGWNLDVIYERCKQEGMVVLADIKTCPEWLLDTYPKEMRNRENAPAPYGADLEKAASYADQARMAFQFAARYGYNNNIDKSLVLVDTLKRWNGDSPNEIRIGMGLIKYMECENERDRTWGPAQTRQTPEQYAANMSAFYDGDMGKLGPNAGVKTADPNMQVVMGGLASFDIKYVQRMVEWCKRNRGYTRDGKVNLCFDVINYHLYLNDGFMRFRNKPTSGIAPELSIAGSIANQFVHYADSLPQHPEVWVTENGYDVNQGSYQKAIAIGNKSILETQADWILRSALHYMRFGIKRLFFYQLFDDSPNNPTQYASSGLAEGIKRRPAADYILQANKLIGEYNYIETINRDPVIDKYQKGNHTIFVLTVPDQTGRVVNYSLEVGKASNATIYHLKVGADSMDKTEVNIINGKLSVLVTETPVFVEFVEK